MKYTQPRLASSPGAGNSARARGLQLLSRSSFFTTVRYSGVLGPASKWRPLVVPKPVTEARGEAASPGAPDSCGPPPPRDTTGSRYRPWAELLKRTFGNDVETCARCGGRMRLLALITDPPNVAGTSRARTDGILLGATGERCRASPEASRECRIPERSCGGPER